MTATSRHPFLVALTGGIASGKSAAAQVFADLGVPVLDTDVIAREVVAPGSPVLQQLATRFGDDIMTPAGELDRARLRQHVFRDPAEREALNAIMHPAIRAELARQSERAGGTYQIHVIPLLVETQRMKDYDRVLVVDCPEEDQLRRLMARDGGTLDEAKRILAAQASRAERLAAAHDVILNTGTIEDLAGAVAELHRQYEKLARAS
jgi:dephospho-CoA kinase